jgi:hypothetical protein
MHALLLTLAAPLAAETPTLDLTDTLLGTGTATPLEEHLGLVPGHPARFDLTGPALGPVALFASLDQPAGVPLGSGLLELDPGSAVLLGATSFDAAGVAAIELDPIPSLPLGLELRTQAFHVDPTTQAVAPSNSLSHETTLLGFEVLVDDKASIHPLSEFGGVLVIEDAASWAAFWSQHDAYTPPQPLPAVDFTRDVVVASFFGTVFTTGYDLTVDGLVAGPGALDVAQTLDTPGFGCGGGFAASRPHVFLVVDRVAAAAQVGSTTTLVPGDSCP